MRTASQIGALLLVVVPTCAAEPAFRYSAPLSVTQPGAYVMLPLPASAYARSQGVGLSDLRLLDARGERVPHALLPPRADAVQERETLREATAYPLPRRTAPGAAPGLPVEVMVQGDTIRVRRPAAAAPVASPGWLFDLGERVRDAPAPMALRLAWSGQADFGVAYDIDLSDNLRDWRRGGSGQLLALSSPNGPLVQREVPLPAGAARFVRLLWRDGAGAPPLTGAQAVTLRQAWQPQDEPTTLRYAPSAPATDPVANPAAAAKALHFDLGGALPLATLDLQLPPGTRVAPVRLQGRVRADEPWREFGSAVFYRIERDGQASSSPPLPLQATLRYLRIWPDERSPALDPASTQLVLRAHLATLLFAAQGQAPYRLLAGAADAPPGALPAATLVPQLQEERPRFGRAELGAWTEEATVAAMAAAAERQAALRPWLLWAVLGAGVAGLGVMVWRLARKP